MPRKVQGGRRTGSKGTFRPGGNAYTNQERSLKVRTLTTSENVNTGNNVTFPDGTSLTTAFLPFNHKRFTGTKLYDGTNGLNKPGNWTKADPKDVELVDLSVKIQPNSASQKVVIQISICGEWELYPNQGSVSLQRVIDNDDTWLDGRDKDIDNRMPLNAMFAKTADTASISPETLSFIYVDEPNTTSVVTYKVYIKTRSTQSFALNRTIADGSNSDYERGISTITVECRN